MGAFEYSDLTDAERTELEDRQKLITEAAKRGMTVADYVPAENRENLRKCLNIAVPLWMAKVAAYRPQQRRERAYACGGIIAHHGDCLQFGKAHNKPVQRDLVQWWLDRELPEGGYEDSPKPAPSVAEMFNVLAEGLAILAIDGGETGRAQVEAFLHVPTCAVCDGPLEHHDTLSDTCDSCTRKRANAYFEAAKVRRGQDGGVDA